MESIFLVVSETSEAQTQGYFKDRMKLEVYSDENNQDKLFPAFTNNEDAQKFIEKVFNYWRPEVIEVQIFDK